MSKITQRFAMQGRLFLDYRRFYFSCSAILEVIQTFLNICLPFDWTWKSTKIHKIFDQIIDMYDWDRWNVFGHLMEDHTFLEGLEHKNLENVRKLKLDKAKDAWNSEFCHIDQSDALRKLTSKTWRRYTTVIYYTAYNSRVRQLPQLITTDS